MLITPTPSQEHRLLAKRLVLKKQQLLPTMHPEYDKELIHSIRSANNYIECISQYLAWRGMNGLPDGERDNRQQAIIYLEERSEIYSQATLNQHRLALMKVFGLKLPFVKSQLETLLLSRDYRDWEINLITDHQSEKHALSTLIAFHAGLRAHELITLRPLGVQERSQLRDWGDELFLGLPEHQIYTVKGKGGLVRWVAIPTLLADYLEQFRLPTPIPVVDRKVFYDIFYAIGFGQSLSQSFSFASKKYLGFSTGFHGLRHTYAKSRLRTLVPMVGLKKAQLIISQELGHFRPEITYTYFR